MSEHPAIQALNRTCTDVARSLMEQRTFFEDLRDDLPLSERQLVAQHGERYSGARSDDEATNLLVGAMRLLGCSDRAIEKKAGVDRRTIPFRLRNLEKAGRIPALKERLLVIVGEVAEQSGIVVSHLLAQVLASPGDADLAAMLRSVGQVNSFAVTQTQLLTGAPTEIVEHRAGAGRAEIEAFWKDAAIPIEAEVVAVDSASTGKAAEPATSGASEPDRHGGDTADGDQGQLGDREPDRGEGGRGGSLAGAGAEKVNGLVGCQNSTKEGDGNP